MRFLVALALVVGCGSTGSGGAPHDAAERLDGLSCLPAGGCMTGPQCGNTCCASGESCVAGTCTCGGKAACTMGNMCVSPLAMMNGCGTLCCGATGPCPGN